MGNRIRALSGHARCRRAALAVAFVGFCLVLAGQAAAAPGDVGFQGPSSTGSNPTGEKPESKLWFNDGIWWANFWDSSSSRHEIFRLDWATQTWSSTNVATDTRSSSRSDVLWDGSKLFVASHPFTTSPSLGAADASRLYRYSYDGATDTYTLDAGFPATINSYNLEALVIDRDSLGRLWATWVEGGKVWIARTSGDDAVWNAPFQLPATGAGNVSSDDISSLIAFGGKIGVMYSNQTDDTMHFAIHNDADPDATWTHEAAYGSPGSNLADDHINLKASGGLVFAATKTSRSGSTDPLIALLVRGTAGVWSAHTFGTGNDDHTRPIVLVDESASQVYVFATGKSTTTSYDAIFQKNSPIGAISFTSGDGTPFIDPVGDNPKVNNPTSTKQNLNGSTDLVVAASGGGRYWHNFIELAPPPTGPPVNTTPPSISGSPVVGQTLTLDKGIWSGALPITYTYQWERCNPTCTPIADEEGTTYTLVQGDLGATIDAVVTAQNGEGTVPATAPAVGPVTEPPPVATFTPVADAHVRDTSPTSNYGSDPSLRVRAPSPDYDAYVKFDVTGVTGTVQSAKLRLYVTDASNDGGSFYSVSNFLRNTSTPWTDGNVNWSNAPTLSGAVVGSAGSTTVGTWEEIDVTSVVTGNGTYSFGFSTPSTNSAYYSSKEGTNPPQLVVAFASGPDVTPPTVTDRSPADFATNVGVGANVTATFSEDVQGVDGATFTLEGPGGVGIPATVSYSSSTHVATLDPSSDLSLGTTYTATLTGGAGAIRDLADLALATTAWSFATAPPDGLAPTVSNRSPADFATGVAIGANVTATFSEDVQGVDLTTFTLEGPGGAGVTASVTYSSSSHLATLDPSSALAPLTTYTATLTGGAGAIRDLAGNPLVTTSWTFTTGAAPSGAIARNGSAITVSISTGTSAALPSWAPDGNDLILVQISQRDELRAITVSGNCPTWNEAANVDNVQGQGGLALFWAQCAAPTAEAITVTIAGNTRPVVVVAQRFSGVDTTTPIEAMASHPGPLVDDANMLTSVTTATPGAWVVGAGWDRTKTFTVPAGETGILTNAVAGASGDMTMASMWYEGPVASPGSVQLGAAGDLSGANDWAMVAVSLRPAP